MLNRVRMGLLRARYSFVLNPYVRERFTKCPTCDAPTRARKLPLVIHINHSNDPRLVLEHLVRNIATAMMRIRKQVNELTKTDLTDFPIWEFALDEEGEQGQDEATVRPWHSEVPPDPADGMFVARAAFVLADGSRHIGYLTLPVDGEESLSTVQPVIVTDNGQIWFWYGVIAPSLEAIREAYGKLGRAAEAVFPVRYGSEVPFMGGQVTGSLAGFAHFRSFKDQTIIQVT